MKHLTRPILLSLALTGRPLAADPEPSSRPNVLFLAVDDMNDWIGCLESTPRARTPNIDRLAKRGVNFTNAHTAEVFCAPSRAAMFTGQFASTTGCNRTARNFAISITIPTSGSTSPAILRTPRSWRQCGSPHRRNPRADR